MDKIFHYDEDIKHFTIYFEEKFNRCDTCQKTTTKDYSRGKDKLENPILVYFHYGNLVCLDCFLNTENRGLKSLVEYENNY